MTIRGPIRTARDGSGLVETTSASDEVIDAIAEIKAQCQAMEQDDGAAAARSGALRRLQALLDDVRAALHSQGPDAGNFANIDAVTTEIERVKKHGAIMDRALSRDRRPEPRQVALRSGTRTPPRNKGRRTMGRAGGR